MCACLCACMYQMCLSFPAFKAISYSINGCGSYLQNTSLEVDGSTMMSQYFVFPSAIASKTAQFNPLLVPKSHDTLRIRIILKINLLPNMVNM